jgi:hypothetical protein
MKGEDFPSIFADWSHVIERFRHLSEDTDDYPRRYRVRELPYAKMIDAIGSTEVG